MQISRSEDRDREPHQSWRQSSYQIRQTRLPSNGTEVSDIRRRTSSSASVSSDGSSVLISPVILTPVTVSPLQPLNEVPFNKTLTEGDIAKVLDLIHTYGYKWIEIGLQLGFVTSELDTIKSMQSLFMSSPTSFLRELLSRWVQWPTHDHPINPTLRALCTALRTSLVGLGSLACKVEANFTIGGDISCYRQEIRLSNEADINKLERRLRNKTTKMRLKFHALVYKYFTTLQDKGVTVERISAQIKHLHPDNVELLKSVENRDDLTLDVLQSTIKQYSSFYDYNLVKYMIESSTESMIDESIRRELREYEEAFHQYIQHRLYECTFYEGSVPVTDTRLHIKLDKMYDRYSIDVLEDLQWSLSEILDKDIYLVRLLKVKRGCFKVTLLIPKSFEQTIFPLSGDQLQLLKQLSVTKLDCGQHFYDVDGFVSQEGAKKKTLRKSAIAMSITPWASTAGEYDIQVKTAEFEKDFSMLLKETKSELTSKSRLIPSTGMRVMPCSVKRSHYQYVRMILCCQDKTFIDLDEFFLYLNMYSCNCFEYKLLQDVIESSNCSSALHNEMLRYADVVQQFQRQTKCSAFFGEQQEISTELIPPQFETIAITYKFDPDQFTVATLDTFRKQACSSMKISEYALMNVSLRGSDLNVIVKWMFPLELRNTMIYFFCGKSGQGLLKMYQVETMIIMDKLLYKHYARSNGSSSGSDIEEGEQNYRDDMCQLLLSAVATSDTAKVMSILEDEEVEVDVNCTDEFGHTPLLIASEQGSLDIVEKLCNKRANVHLTDKNGKTVLMAAIESGNKNLTEFCLKLQEWDVNVQEKKNGWSALHFAAKTGNRDIMKLLIEQQYEFDVSLKDNNHKTAHDVALDNGFSEIAELVIEDADNISGSNVETDEPNACENMGMDECQLKTTDGGIKPTKARKDYAPLLRRRSKLTQATRKGLTDEVQRLLAMGKDPNTVKGDSDEWTPLMHASHQGYTEIVRLLLEHKANPNMASSGEGWTALILASYRGFVDIVKLLIKHGCNVNAQTKKRKVTALQRVCLYSEDRYVFMRFKPSDRRAEVVHILLENGADITLRDNQKRTPLIAASRSGFPVIVNVILDRICKDYPDVNERKKILDIGMTFGWTALMEASEEGHANIIKMLLDAGATPGIQKRDKDSALHIAAYYKHHEVVWMLAEKMILEEINAKNKSGMTPLILAAKRKALKVMEVLKHFGADPMIKSNSNKTVMDYAQKGGDRRVITMIKDWLKDRASQDPQTLTLVH